MAVLDQLPSRLRTARKASGLKRTPIASAVNRSVDALASYEYGRAVPPLGVLAQLCSLYGISLSELLAEDDDS